MIRMLCIVLLFGVMTVLSAQDGPVDRPAYPYGFGARLPGVRMDWHPSGSVYARTNGNSVEIRSFPAESLLHTIPASSIPVDVSWSPTGSNLAVGETRRITIFRYNLTTDALTFAHSYELTEMQSVSGITALEWHSDGGTVIVVAQQGIFRFDIASGTLSERYSRRDMFLSYATSPDGTFSAAGTLGRYILVEELSTGRKGGLYLDHTTEIAALDWNPHTNQLFVGDGLGWLYGYGVGTAFPQIDLYQRRIVPPASSQIDAILQLDWHPVNPTVLAVGRASGAVEIYEVPLTDFTTPILHNTYAAGSAVTVLGWSPDGTRLAYASAQGLTLATPPEWVVAPGAASPAMKVITGLSSPVCRPACWFGMQPGVTTLSQVMSISNDYDLGITVIPGNMGGPRMIYGSFNGVGFSTFVADEATEIIGDIMIDREFDFLELTGFLGSPDWVWDDPPGYDGVEVVYSRLGIILSYQPRYFGGSEFFHRIRIASPNPDEFRSFIGLTDAAGQPASGRVQSGCTTFGAPPCIVATATPTP